MTTKELSQKLVSEDNRDLFNIENAIFLPGGMQTGEDMIRVVFKGPTLDSMTIFQQALSMNKFDCSRSFSIEDGNIVYYVTKTVREFLN